MRGNGSDGEMQGGSTHARPHGEGRVDGAWAGIQRDEGKPCKARLEASVSFS